MNIRIRWFLVLSIISVFRRAYSKVDCGYQDVQYDCITFENTNGSHTETINGFGASGYGDCFKYSHWFSGEKRVHFKNCQFPTLPQILFQEFKMLHRIFLDNSGVQVIDRNFLPKDSTLRSLSISHNSLTEIPESFFSNTPELSEADFSYNQIKTIDPKALSGVLIGKINLAHNLIETIDEELFASSKYLSEVDLSYNQLEKFEISGTNFNYLESLILSHNKIVKLDCNIFPNVYQDSVVLIDASSNQLTDLDLNCDHETNYALTLSIDDNLLENLTLPSTMVAVNLNASRNNIKTVSIESDLKRLKQLRLANNGLTDVSSIVENCSSLLILDLSSNDIHEFNTDSTWAELEELNLSNNKMTQLSCSAIPSSMAHQISVDVSMNQLKEIDLNCEKTNNQWALNIGDNVLENLTLPASPLVKNLTSLLAASNKLKTISIESELPRLTELNVANNSLSSLLDIFKHCTALEILDLSFNTIQKLRASSFMHMAQLKNLYLQNMNLSQLKYGTLSYSRNLRVLDLSHNNLAQFNFDWFFVPLADFAELHLNDNRLTHLSGSFKVQTIMPNLKILSISNNNFACNYLSQLFQEISSTQAKIMFQQTIEDPEDERAHFNGVACMDGDNNDEPLGVSKGLQGKDEKHETDHSN